MTTLPMISVIVPFFNAADYLHDCLAALRRSDYVRYELVLMDDGSTDSSRAIAQRFSDRVLSFPSPRGPAFARNRGAEAASGEILLFIDSDVYCHSDTLSRIASFFSSGTDHAAVIGSYDDAPPAANFLSRYKNLTHHFVHQTSRAEASTFWTGCGAIRRDAFFRLGGFDESYGRPSIEDIELGYRLRASGLRISLRSDILVKHAKRWTFWSLLRSDIRDRAIPWTLLQLSYGKIINDLNISLPQRAASVCIWLALLLGLMSFWNLWFLAAAGAMLLPAAIWNRRLYRFYFDHGGAWFCARGIMMHWLYYLYSVVSFAAGCMLHLVRKRKAARTKA